MAIDALSEEGRIIRRLFPLVTLPNSWFTKLCERLVVEDAEDGQYLFKRGDNFTELFYLIKGLVSLETEEFKFETIHAGTDSSRFSLAHQIPRKVNAIAKGKIRYLRLQADILKILPDMAQEESNNNMIDNQLAENDDWMTTLLMSPIFRALPPANLQRVLMSLQEVRYKAGESIINQGEEGDYFYIIKKGQCLITRKPSANAKDIKLAIFNEQDAFGEDALISGLPRNASVSASSDVSLLRLNKEQFLKLIKQPILKYVNYPDATELLAKGAVLIDVREPEEFNKYHLPRSINIPFFSLRMHLRTMNRQQPVVLVCKDGTMSDASAFVLMRYRFTAYVLFGGIDKIGSDLLNSNAAQVELKEPEPSTVSVAPLSEPTEVERLRMSVYKLKAQNKALLAEKNVLEEKCAKLAKHLQMLTAQLKTNKQ